MRLTRNPVADNALWHLEAYGIHNPFVRECIALGAYGRKELPVTDMDFGTPEDLAEARRLNPRLVVSRPPFGGMGVRRIH